MLQPGQWYSKQNAFIFRSCKLLGFKDATNQCGLGCLRAQIDGRYFPISDHHIRGFSIIGEADRCFGCFSSSITFAR